MNSFTTPAAAAAATTTTMTMTMEPLRWLLAYPVRDSERQHPFSLSPSCRPLILSASLDNIKLKHKKKKGKRLQRLIAAYTSYATTPFRDIDDLHK